MNKIKYFIQSLERPERLKYIEKNKKIIQDIEIYKSINGYNIDETCNEFYKSGLKYTELHKDYETYGTLANYLTKINAFKYQIENNIEYMCLIEDDLILDKDFPKFIEDNLHFLEEYNILQLDEWGEGYITSLEGAKNVLNDITKDGIIKNIDNQLSQNCSKNKRLYNTPWILAIPPNLGDCMKTEQIPDSIIKNFKEHN